MAAISVKRSVGVMKGACNPNLQVAITCTYGWHIHGASFSWTSLKNGWNAQNANLIKLFGPSSFIISSRLFLSFITWNLRKRSKVSCLLSLSPALLLYNLQLLLNYCSTHIVDILVVYYSSIITSWELTCSSFHTARCFYISQLS